MTGGADHRVKLWDTNELKVACEFELPGRVAAVAMSPVSTQHTLVAAAGAGSDVLLCDPVAGVATHQLSELQQRHRAPACSLEQRLPAGRRARRAPAASRRGRRSADLHELFEASRACTTLWDIRRARARAAIV